MNNNVIDNLSLVLQMISLEILFRDYNNGDLMQELQNQDSNYLEKIIKQNEEIIKILKEGEKYGNREKNHWKNWRINR